MSKIDLTGSVARSWQHKQKQSFLKNNIWFLCALKHSRSVRGTVVRCTVPLTLDLWETWHWPILSKLLANQSQNRRWSCISTPRWIINQGRWGVCVCALHVMWNLRIKETLHNKRHHRSATATPLVTRWNYMAEGSRSRSSGRRRSTRCKATLYVWVSLSLPVGRELDGKWTNWSRWKTL